MEPLIWRLDKQTWEKLLTQCRLPIGDRTLAVQLLH